MTVPTAGTPPEAPGQCTSCTVPTTRPDGLCSFCADPPPPLDNPRTRLMDSAANHAHCALFDVEKQIQGMPADAVLWASVDLVQAQRHLLAAVRLIENVGAPNSTRR
ncbi:MAG: hypothetical protein E6R06_26170 [Mycobacterium sp.]|nr:MAG: hypothetical protein E6R06_26170 [Mycobacterium sp.]